jgi:hypothetical protein
MQSSKNPWFYSTVFLAGLLAGLIWQGGELPTTAAIAQTMRSASTGGVMAFPVQLGREEQGLAMIDTDAGTLWLYQYKLPGFQLKLLAARSWMYDRYLEEYNCAPLTPSEVAELIDQQGGKNGALTPPKTLEKSPQ